MLNKVLVIISILVMSACSNEFSSAPNSPQKTLAEYVSRSFGVSEAIQKNKLIELSTGSVKQTIESLNEEVFKKEFLESKREFKNLKIKDERKLSDNEYSITYEITFSRTNKNTEGKDPSVDLITNKKHALFVKTGDRWLISEVKNLKTFIEHQKRNELLIKN